MLVLSPSQHVAHFARALALGLTGISPIFAVACGPSDEGDSSSDTEEPEVAAEIFGELGEPMALANDGQVDLFERGEEVALRRFSPGEGLGPSFNVTFCASCHEQPAFGGSSPRYRDFYLVGEREGGFVPIDEPPGEPKEEGFETIEAPEPKIAKNGVQLRYRTEYPYRNRTPEAADVVARRNAIPFFGVGAISEISDEEILKREDPNDADGDGISGRANIGETGAIGRFGRKAQTESLEGFVRGPLFNHAGITTRPLTSGQRSRLPLNRTGGEPRPTARPPLRSRDQGQVATGNEPLEDSDSVSDPELPREELFELVSWVRLLAAPEPDELDETGEEGEGLFETIGCADCHVPRLEGPRGAVPLYSDLLLHDMGEELADGIAQADATGAEFRTQPLWGVAAVEPYLHDGRASTLDEAIRMHGGEAQRARDEYVDLSDSERRAVVAFLRSLGGAERDSDGLIPPDESAPPAGEYGGPVVGLGETRVEMFERGRRIFDGDVDFEDGLGPDFNGDSCRACHFEPTPGGAGPAGVDVTREGRLDSDGTFVAPPEGTLLHRFWEDLAERPAPSEDSNSFELRQAPPLYGLGLIDRIPASAIEANADPEDADGDGVSGRVSTPVGGAEGAVGRFGWKAEFPTLHDFTRDALSNEMGLAVPERPGVFAGYTSDADEVADPEIQGERYDALVFYVERLGPPPKPEELDERASQGEELFEEVGCADCHVPSMRTEDGTTVELYSDLLLHEVVPADYRGIGSAGARPREFRTPPLWGVSETGPYMHDGLQGTLDGAIRAHAGEAKSAREAYTELSEGQREALISFLESI